MGNGRLVEKHEGYEELGRELLGSPRRRVFQAEQLARAEDLRYNGLGQEDPLEKRMAIHSSILAWRFHGQRSRMGYSPWEPKELDMTE